MDRAGHSREDVSTSRFATGNGRMGDARGVNKGEEEGSSEGIMGGSCSGRRRVFSRFDPI